MTEPIADEGKAGGVAPSSGAGRASAWMDRRDAPGLVRYGIQSLLLVASAGATLELAAAGDGRMPLALAACAVALLGFFPSLHECGHRTAFRTPLANELGVALSAFLMLQAPSFFRSFHWEHHRETQDPERDPEISSARDLLDGWPTNPASYLFVVSGQALMVGKFGFTAACGLLPRGIWTRIFPFIRGREQRRVAWESRAVLILWIGVVWAGLAYVPGFWALLLAWPLSHLLLGLYLMPEHTGLPNEGSQLERTRTVISSAALRWWMWNMPFHAEHHAHPGVPFHRLPAVHGALEAELVNLHSGYLAFHREAIARAFRRGVPEAGSRSA